MAITFLMLALVIGFAVLEGVINAERHDRIAQCERGNTISLSLRGLANDFGANAQQVAIVARRFPTLDCEHPETVTTTTSKR